MAECGRCGETYDEATASISEVGLVCQSCHLALEAAEASPDTQAEALLRCPHCGELSARIAVLTHHERGVTVVGVEAGSFSQGASFEYQCKRCDRGFSLLSKKRRFWFYYGVVIGVLLGGLGGVLGGGGLVFIPVGAIALIFSVGVLLWDSNLRKKSAV